MAKELYEIREMKEEDIGQIVQIEGEIFSDAWSETSVAESLNQDHVKILVAESDQGILGYHIFYMSIDEGDVARIAVRPQCRRMGIGDQLLECMWNYCRESGIYRVLLEVRSSNANAIHLYEKHGFVSLGIRKGYYKEPLEDGVIMEKQIDISTRN